MMVKFEKQKARQHCDGVARPIYLLKAFLRGEKMITNLSNNVKSNKHLEEILCKIIKRMLAVSDSILEIVPSAEICDDDKRLSTIDRSSSDYGEEVIDA